MHIVYISLGNIPSATCQKISEGAWILLVRIPTSKFPLMPFHTKMEAEHMPGILQCQLFHCCLCIVFEPLQTN
jgi:Plavaka transposase